MSDPKYRNERFSSNLEDFVITPGGALTDEEDTEEEDLEDTDDE